MATSENEEETLDARLKVAGLWEEGLSLDEKRQYCNFLIESCSSAKRDEQRRQWQQNEELASHDKPSIEPTDAGCKSRKILHKVPAASEEKKKVETSDDTSNESAQSIKTIGGKKQEDVSLESTSADSFHAASETVSDDNLCSSTSHLSSPKTLRVAAGVQKQKKVEKEESEFDRLLHGNLTSVLNDKDSTQSTVNSSHNSLLEEDLTSLESSQSLLDPGCVIEYKDENSKSVDQPAQVQTNVTLDAGEQTLLGANLSCVDSINEVTLTASRGMNNPSPKSSPKDGKDDSNCASSSLFVNMSSRMPSWEIVEKYSQRINDIRFRDLSHYNSASEETRAKMYKEVLESLTKTSYAIAESLREPNKPMPWKRVIKPPRIHEKNDKEISFAAEGAYSLRKRRTAPKHHFVSSSVEEEMDELPEIEQIVQSKDNEWIPRSHTSGRKRKRADKVCQPPKTSSRTPLTEYQSSDDDSDFHFTKRNSGNETKQAAPVPNGSALPNASDEENFLPSMSPAGWPEMRVDPALLTSMKPKCMNSAGNKKSKYESVIKVTSVCGESDGSSSDLDVVEIDEISTKFSAQKRASMKSSSLVSQHPASDASSSENNNSNASTTNQPIASSSKNPTVYKVSNCSSFYGKNTERERAKGECSNQVDLSPEIKPPPVKIRGEKRPIATGALPIAKMLCRSPMVNISKPSNKALQPSSVEACGSNVTSKSSTTMSQDEIRAHHQEVLALADRRRLLEESQGSKSRTSNDEGDNSVQCPICTSYFSQGKIESHASSCNGEIITRAQTLQRQLRAHKSYAAKSKTQSSGNVTTIDSDPDDVDETEVLSARATRTNTSNLPRSSGSTLTRGRSSRRNVAVNDGLVLPDSDDDCKSIKENISRSSAKAVSHNGVGGGK